MVTTTYEPTTHAVGSATSQSAVAWAAVFAGALAACVLSLLLFMLGIGLGLSSISVWSGQGAEGSTVGMGAIVWLVVTQLVSAGVGGYLAGRLRAKWQGVHSDEVYFRDTAHGFLSWALATIAMVILAGSVLGSAISGVGKAAGAVASGAATVASGAANVVGGAVGTVGSVAGGAATAAIGAATGQVASGDNDLGYWISSLMRNGGLTEAQKKQATDKVAEVAGNVADKAGEAAENTSGTVSEVAQDLQQKAQEVQKSAPELPQKAKAAAAQARDAAADAKEVGMVFSQALKTGKLPENDADYVASIIAQHSDISEAEAKEKVQKTFDDIQQGIEDAKQAAKEAQEKAMQAADDARKATAHSMLWMFVVLLIGAFVGSLSATYGGRQRNNA